MKHTMKIMIPFLMIAGLLTGCGSQETTGSKAETTQATKTETTTALSEQETQTETEQTPEAADAVIGTMLQVSAGGMTADANAEGSFECTYIEGTETGAVVQGRFH